MVILETKNLHKTFANGLMETKVLKDINLEIKKGEFTVIMGPSGSGKSTLLYLLGGLEPPTEGSISFDGVDINQMKESKLSQFRRREMGFIFQFYNLVPVLDVEENILMPILLDNRKVDDYKDRAKTLIEAIGLGERLKHKPTELSGGQQQRVSIARALINDPKVVLADEPTGNLDSTNSKEILLLMRKFCTEFDRTIVMVTHDPEAAEYADRILVMKDGRIVEDRYK